jgi:hypothetical protein
VEGVRRIAENRLVERIGPDRAVASHTLISQEEAEDADVARSVVEAGGFDGAITMRVVGRDQQLSYEPGMSYPVYYGSFYS